MRSRPTSSALLVLALVLLALTSCERNSEDRSGDLEDRLEKLRSVPYTATTSEKVSADTSGVMLYDRKSAWPGYNLYCSRITPEAFLLDMDGNAVHTWSHLQDDGSVWDYAIMLDNGDLIVLDKYHYISQLDWNSNVIWERQLSVHHDVARTDDGSLFVLEMRMHKHRDLLVEFDNVALLDAQGNVLSRWSSYDHLEDLKRILDPASFLDTVLDLRETPGEAKAHDMLDRLTFNAKARKEKRRRSSIYDYFHFNTITILPETPLGVEDPRFAAGNLLLCLRNVNQIATMDWDTGDVLWGWGEGVLEWPHHPTMLPNGNILVFDNGVLRKASRILEIEPASGEIVWEYQGSPPESFYSPGKGSCMRLPGGTTLICEGDRGRVFEVTPEGEKVWEWFNPLLKDGRRVQVYRMLRLPTDLIDSIMARHDG